MQNWIPNFFIAGAPKAGTSSVHRWLADHPEVMGSHEKETYFFVDPGTHMFRPESHISKGFETWKHQFDSAKKENAKVILESTPGYIYYDTALEHIPALSTKPKCLFIVREPVAQLKSLYSYFQNNWDWIPDKMSFAEFIEASKNNTHDFKGNELAQFAYRNGHYIDFLRKWHAFLGDDRMKVSNFNDLQRNPVEFIRDLASWLGIDPDFYLNYDFPRENESYVPKSRLLQSINIFVRSRIPKGSFYNELRSIYRRINTKKGHVKIDLNDQEFMQRLRKEFHDSNLALKNEFGVDLRQQGS